MLPISQTAVLRQSDVKVTSSLIQPLSVTGLVAFKYGPARPRWSPSLVGGYLSSLGHRHAQVHGHARMSRMDREDLALGTQWTGLPPPPPCRALLIPSLDASPCRVPPDFPEARTSSPTVPCRELRAVTSRPERTAYRGVSVTGSDTPAGASLAPHPQPESPEGPVHEPTFRSCLRGAF